MALPASLRASLSPFELEFIASEDLIDIEPLFRMDQIRLVSGTYGPFRPPSKTRIPVWMARSLKLKKKCRIIAPEWLTVENLQDRIKEETSLEEFSKLPFRFAEIAKILLDIASDDLVAPDKIRMLLKDLREARQAKSREGLRKIDNYQLALPNLCAIEINEIRPFFLRAMNVVGKLTLDIGGEASEAEEGDAAIAGADTGWGTGPAWGGGDTSVGWQR